MDKKLLFIIAFLLGLTIIPPILEHLTFRTLDEDEIQLVVKIKNEE